MTRLQGGHCSRARWAPPLGKLSAISGISGLSWFQPRAWEKEEGIPPSAMLLRRTKRQKAERPGKATQSHSLVKAESRKQKVGSRPGIGCHLWNKITARGSL